MRLRSRKNKKDASLVEEDIPSDLESGDENIDDSDDDPDYSDLPLDNAVVSSSDSYISDEEGCSSISTSKQRLFTSVGTTGPSTMEPAVTAGSSKMRSAATPGPSTMRPTATACSSTTQLAVTAGASIVQQRRPNARTTTVEPEPEDGIQPSQRKPTWGKSDRTSNTAVFTSTTGPTACVKDMDEPTPSDLFHLFITPEIIELIVFQTNLYAEQNYQKTGKVYVPTSAEEIKTFLGVNILMGIKPLPSYRDYWSTSSDLHDSYISQLMTVNRFGWLLTNLHLNDNSAIPRPGDANYDKLFKLRPFLSKVAENFEKNFQPSEIMAVDESMIKFKGRSSLRQYLPNKPIKRGYKVWVLADKTGYMLKFEIYTGKKHDKVEKHLGERVVKNLVQDMSGKSHRVYFDNYFTSTSLLEDLKDKEIYACGTVNPTRKNLPALKEDKNMKRGDYDWATSDTGLSMMKWKDKRCVHLLSNFHDPENVVEVTRKEKDGTQIKVPCPKALDDYNNNMNCVDKFDQLKGTYEVNRKSKKWWHRIFWYFIDASVVNAYIVHKEMQLPKESLKNFRRDISRSLVSRALVSSRAQKKRKSSTTPEIKQKKPHVPKVVRLESSAHQPERSTRRRCAKCSSKKNQIRTDWICSVCKVPLCLGKTKSCFQDYHRE